MTEETNITKPSEPEHERRQQQEQEIIELENLIQIEDPQYAGKTIKVKAVVASNTVSYNVPAEVDFECKNLEASHVGCGKGELIKLDVPKMVSFVEVSEDKRSYLLSKLNHEQYRKDCYLAIRETKQTIVKKMRVRPVVEGLEISKNHTVIDTQGNEYKAFDVYVMQEELQQFEAGRVIDIIGTVTADPKSQRITLAVTKATISENVNLDTNKVKELQVLFRSNESVHNIIQWIIEEFAKYSKIVNRSNLTVANFLTAFSSLIFVFDGKVIPGWVKCKEIGDSTTAKSESARAMLRLLKCGEVISGELASVVGLGAVATQTSQGNWFLEYGPLVLQDRKLLVIDGAHKLFKSEQARLAESERSGLLKITKAAKGEVNARTRTISIMNPIGEDRAVRPIASFYYSCEALTFLLELQSIARIDLAVFVPSDVKAEDVNKRLYAEHDARLEYLSELLKVVWHGNYDIQFEEDATDLILKSATEFYNNYFVPEIPLCSIDMKYKLARLAIALANLTCSFNDGFTLLTVRKEHVEFVVSFIQEEYKKAGLNALSKRSKQSEIDSEDIPIIIGNIKTALRDKEPIPTEQSCKDIVTWIAQEAKFTKDQLKEKFTLHENNEARPLMATLTTDNLITRNSKGFMPTKKCIDLARMLIGGTLEV